MLTSSHRLCALHATLNPGYDLLSATKLPEPGLHKVSAITTLQTSEDGRFTLSKTTPSKQVFYQAVYKSHYLLKSFLKHFFILVIKIADILSKFSYSSLLSVKFSLCLIIVTKF